eukprot:scaffold119193_cov51-Phaeocystis_antarctica.AAC.2
MRVAGLVHLKKAPRWRKKRHSHSPKEGSPVSAATLGERAEMRVEAASPTPARVPRAARNAPSFNVLLYKELPNTPYTFGRWRDNIIPSCGLCN